MEILHYFSGARNAQFNVLFQAGSDGESNAQETYLFRMAARSGGREGVLSDIIGQVAAESSVALSGLLAVALPV